MASPPGLTTQELPPSRAGNGGGGNGGIGTVTWVEITDANRGSVDGGGLLASWMDSLEYVTDEWVATWLTGVGPTTDVDDMNSLIDRFSVPATTLFPTFDPTLHNILVRIEMLTPLSSAQDDQGPAIGLENDTLTPHNDANGICVFDDANAINQRHRLGGLQKTGLFAEFGKCDALPCDAVGCFKNGVDKDQFEVIHCMSDGGVMSGWNDTGVGGGYDLTDGADGFNIITGMMANGAASVASGTVQRFRWYAALAAIVPNT